MKTNYESVDDYVSDVYHDLSKRAKQVVDIIRSQGSVTTGDLNNIGYEHAPRAARDVREAGIPLKTKMVTIDGVRMASYTFGDPSKIRSHKHSGRTTFSKKFKQALVVKQSRKCAICGEEFDEKLLQIDHRIPFEFMENSDALNPQITDFMLLCPECNRKKDQATREGCAKTCFLSGDLNIIRSCFWASPENYTHICMKPIRYSEITWNGKNELSDYKNLKYFAEEHDISINQAIKHIVHEYLDLSGQ